MDFNLTEERQMLQDTLRRFLADAATKDSKTLWGELAELGVIGALFTEDNGGFGGAGFDLSLVFEEIGRAGVAAPLLETGILAGGLIAALGNDDQTALLEGIIDGTQQLAFAHSEPLARYDLNHVATTATQTGDGYILNGHKSVVMNGGRADTLIISARTTGDVTSNDGISLFQVDASSVERRSYQTMSGADAAEIYLNDVIVAKTALLGSEGTSFDEIETQVARATAALCAEAVGAMESAKDLTIEYLQTRQQFGRPIGKFQALQHRMADLLVEVEQARSATINVCGYLDADRPLRERHVSAAKNLIGRVGRLVAEETIQMHGGIGMTQEYTLAGFAKRMMMIDHQWGDTDYHLERFIALSRAVE